VAARRQVCAAIAGLFLVVGAAACGSGTGNGGTTSTVSTVSTAPLIGNGDAASRLATTIKNRLGAAGYTAEQPSTLIGSSADPPVPEQAFTVEIEPKSPESFTVTVLVFHSANDAKLFVKHDAAECKLIASCRKTEKANYGQGRQQTIGAVIYNATSDSGTSVVPTTTFQKIIALAQGESK
jgi:hypothetical protein